MAIEIQSERTTLDLSVLDGELFLTTETTDDQYFHQMTLTKDQVMELYSFLSCFINQQTGE